MGLLLVIGIFVATAILMLAAAGGMHRFFGTGVPFVAGLAYLGLVIVAFLALCKFFVYDSGNPFLLMIAVGTAIPCAAAGARMVTGSIGWGAATLLYESKPARPMPTDFSLATTLENRGDTNAALEMYWRYFSEDPRNCRALFRGAALAEQHHRFDDAVDFYEALREFFADDKRTWANASLRLANLTANHRRNVGASNELLESIIQRAHDLEEAETAKKILKRRALTATGD